MSVDWSNHRWWRSLTVQQKVWAVLLLICIPLAIGLSVHLYFVNQLLHVQLERHQLALADSQVSQLRRLAIDIEDGFRGYVLTQQAAFLKPLTEAESKIGMALDDANRTLGGIQGFARNLEPIEPQLNVLLRSKHELITEIQRGNVGKAARYIRSGEGLQLSDRLRQDLRAIEDRLNQRRARLNETAELLSQRTFLGLWMALGGVLGLGWLGSRMLARSLTGPIAKLQSATTQLAERIDSETIASLLSPVLRTTDELGQLAHAYLEMTGRIQAHVNEIEVLDTIGHEINTIGPDGLDGVLRRITDRGVELVKADVCLVLLRNDRMGCWIVEAASGEWSDRLRNSVMLWEELPVCMQAYEKREVAIGEHFRADGRPEVARRNLIGDGMMAIPLLAQGLPFGVLSFLCEAPRPARQWNQRLAKGLAQEAALAISNARLYEASKEKQKGLLARLRHLEHLAETLAHDLKGPGARIEELASLLRAKFAGQLDEHTAKWLNLIQDNGKDIVQRVEWILEVARVGVGQGSVTAVDPRHVIDQVLKAHAGEIERLRATVHVDGEFPLVACHSSYLRQVFDNLLSNALKYARPGNPPSVTIRSKIDKTLVSISFCDRGIGIPSEQRSRVFQPFVRLMQTEAPGSGIGLAIVQRIVELYNGRVWIEGSENEGCTVSFTLPALGESVRGAGHEDRKPDVLQVVDVSENKML